jgi:methyltransferase (TIGR00027 family)
MAHSIREIQSGTAIAVVICGLAGAAIATAQTAKPSATALEMTAYRAIGAKHADPAIRNGDDLAERVLGPEEREILKATGSQALLAALELDTERAWSSLGTRSGLARAVHVRTRHIDAVLDESLRTGTTQIVNLGAGLDSRAYRFGGALRNARVFELDLPATQEYKKNRVRDILGSLPAHVTYVPLDFAKQDLATVLDAAGYDRTATTTFIWEGVTMYIPEPAVDATLRFVASNAASGSRIVFDYFLENGLRSLRELGNRVAGVGEPFVFGMPGEDAAAFVTHRGLRVASDFSYGDLGSGYLPNGSQLPTRSANRICTAVVP